MVYYLKLQLKRTKCNRKQTAAESDGMVWFGNFILKYEIYVIFLGVFSVSGNTPSVRLCFRNIFSVGDIVTDAHLTMY